MRIPSLTASADCTHEVPVGAAERADRIERAIDSLRAEERRLMRLGFELPLGRCREQLRYWEFLRGMYLLAENDEETSGLRRSA